jgi:uncharacterized protein (TIGR03435 family)
MLTLTVLGGVAAKAQQRTFDAASVKINSSGDPGQRMNTLGGRLVAQNMTLRSLIWQAYGVRAGQVDITGVPGWVDSDHFDIEATFTPPASPEQVSQMLQNLLADRFKLVVRRETRRERGYSLVVARTDGALGPALKAARDPQWVRDTPSANGAPPCGQVQFGPGRIAGTSVRWTQLVLALGSPPAVGAPIANNAGERDGLYDFEVRWRPLMRGGGPGREAAADTDVPESIFTAVQEQLGLKLNPTEGALQAMIVVTDARKPDLN